MADADSETETSAVPGRAPGRGATPGPAATREPYQTCSGAAERAGGRARGGPVAESAADPPGPIPNPVVTRRSAGEYCGGDPAGGEAAAVPPDAAGTRRTTILPAPRPGARRRRNDATRLRDRLSATRLRAAAGWSSGSSLGS